MNNLQYNNLADAIATLMTQAQESRQRLTLQLSISPTATNEISAKSSFYHWDCEASALNDYYR